RTTRRRPVVPIEMLYRSLDQPFVKSSGEQEVFAYHPNEEPVDEIGGLPFQGICASPSAFSNPAPCLMSPEGGRIVVRAPSTGWVAVAMTPARTISGHGRPENGSSASNAAPRVIGAEALVPLPPVAPDAWADAESMLTPGAT